MIDTLFQDRELKGSSFNWANWESKLTLTTCTYCASHHGTIIEISEIEDPHINKHLCCRCIYVPMRTKVCGNATDKGLNGADVYILIYKQLPNEYVSKEYAEDAGWDKKRGNLRDVLPGKTIGGDIYRNENEKLPVAKGRIWYEADINYTGGFRNGQRLLYSNDGLIFATYDHYHTFYEITH